MAIFDIFGAEIDSDRKIGLIQPIRGRLGGKGGNKGGSAYLFQN